MATWALLAARRDRAAAGAPQAPEVMLVAAIEEYLERLEPPRFLATEREAARYFQSAEVAALEAAAAPLRDELVACRRDYGATARLLAAVAGPSAVAAVTEVAAEEAAAAAPLLYALELRRWRARPGLAFAFYKGALLAGNVSWVDGWAPEPGQAWPLSAALYATGNFAVTFTDRAGEVAMFLLMQAARYDKDKMRKILDGAPVPLLQGTAERLAARFPEDALRLLALGNLITAAGAIMMQQWRAPRPR